MKSELESLPEELLIEICSYLDGLSFFRLGSASKKLNKFHVEKKSIYEQIQWKNLSIYPENTQYDLLVALFLKLQKTDPKEQLTEKQTIFYLKKLKKFLYESNPQLILRTLALILINILSNKSEKEWINKLIIAMKLLYQISPDLCIGLMTVVAQYKLQPDLQNSYRKQFNFFTFIDWTKKNKIPMTLVVFCLDATVTMKFIKEILTKYVSFSHLILICKSGWNKLDITTYKQLAFKMCEYLSKETRENCHEIIAIINQIGQKIDFADTKMVIKKSLEVAPKYLIEIISPLIKNLDSKKVDEIFSLLLDELRKGVPQLALGKAIINGILALKPDNINKLFTIFVEWTEIKCSPKDALEMLPLFANNIKGEQIKIIINTLIENLWSKDAGVNMAVGKVIFLLWQKLPNKIRKKIDNKILQWIKSTAEDNYTLIPQDYKTFKLLWPLLDSKTKTATEKFFKKKCITDSILQKYLNDQSQDIPELTPKSTQDLFKVYIIELQTGQIDAINDIAQLEENLETPQILQAFQNFYKALSSSIPDLEALRDSHLILLHKLKKEDILTLNTNLETLLDSNKFRMRLFTDVIATFPDILREKSMANIFDRLCNLLVTKFNHLVATAHLREMVINIFLVAINKLRHDQATTLLEKLFQLKENYEKEIQNQSKIYDQLNAIDDIIDAIAKLLKKWNQGPKHFDLLPPLLFDKYNRVEVADAIISLGKKLTTDEADLIWKQNMPIWFFAPENSYLKVSIFITAFGNKFHNQTTKLIKSIWKSFSQKGRNVAEEFYVTQAIAILIFSNFQEVTEHKMLESLIDLRESTIAEDLENLLTNNPIEDQQLILGKTFK